MIPRLFIAGAYGSAGRELQHRLQASSNAEIVKDLFFLDVRSTISQRNQSDAGLQATDGLSVSGNRNQALTVGISPILRQRFGSFADVELAYSRDEVDNSGSVSSSLDSISLSVSSGRRFSALPWTLSTNARREDNSTGSQSVFRQGNATVSYAFSRRYSVRVLGGMENNDAVGNTEQGPSVNWRVTAIWTPTPRTNLEIGYGSQSFGSNFSLQASHTMRRAVFNASYNEPLTTTAFQQSQAVLFALEDAFGNPIENPGEQQVRVATNEAALTDETIVSRSFVFGVSVRGRRGNASLSASNNRRSSVSAADSTTSSLSGSVSRSLSRRSSVNAGANLQLISPGGVNDESTQMDLSLGLTHTVSAGVNYRHQRVSSDVANSSFKENRLSANLAVRF